MTRITHAGSEVRSKPHRLRTVAGFLTSCAIAALSLVATAPPAAADVQEGLGHTTVPGQPYGGAERSADWVGSYLVGGEHVFCVQFEYKAPDSEEKYEPGDELLTKWGEKIPDDQAANISYLLLRHGQTHSPDEAAALAHLLHTWTSAPRSPADLDPDNDFTEIAYDADFHLSKLPPAAQQAVEELTADAEANRGPWTTSVSAPETEQTIGQADEWKVAVRGAQDAGVSDVPVTVHLTDATTEDGSDIITVRTGEDGTATVNATPTGAAPKLVSSLSAPADRPFVRQPVHTDTQKVVSTGGEKTLGAEASTQARTQAGSVTVTKLDSKTNQGIAGVALRVTAADKTEPATDQDGAPLLGGDGQPTVVTTEGEQGTATVAHLRTPQLICVVEARAPDGYGDGFDPSDPPSACGEVTPGETLALQISNAPNAVPRVIPAGTPPVALLHSDGASGPSGAALAGLGALALLGTMLVAVAAHRRCDAR